MDDIVLLALLVFLLAGTIKGVVGIGMPTTSIGVMSQFTDPRLAITLAVFPIVVANGWQMYRAGNILGTVRRYWIFGAVLGVVLLATSLLATSISTTILVTLLGIMIVLFSITSLALKPPILPEKYDRIGQVVAGTLAGISGGLTAIWGPPMIIYFLSRRLDKDEFVRASSVLLLAGSIPLLIGYINNGLLDGPTATLSAILVIPTLLGFTLGELVRRRLGSEKFRTLVLILFLLMGLNLLRRALF